MRDFINENPVLVSLQPDPDSFWCDRVCFELKEGTPIRIKMAGDEKWIWGTYCLKVWYNSHDQRNAPCAGISYLDESGDQRWRPILSDTKIIISSQTPSQAPSNPQANG